MAVYKVHKRGRSSRRVAVRAERIEWNVPAIIVCVLLAFAFWLYATNVANKNAGEKVDPDVTSPEVAVVDVADGVATV